MKELKEYLDSKIGKSNNKNLKVLNKFFSISQLDRLKDRTIAVVGTNGKTSTARFIYQILSEQQYSSLLFTSPHLVNFVERIRTNNDADFDLYLNDIREFEETTNTTLGYFETLFLLASICFLESELDFFICEAGIGGVLDTTSIIQSKNVVLTNIGEDHQDLLGYKDIDVLNQKIFVSSNINNLFIGDLSNELIETVEKNYKHFKSSYYLKDYSRSFNIQIEDLNTNQKNYMLALKTVTSLLDCNINKNFFDSDLYSIEGRFEVINKNPVKILDGAHNLEGVIHLLKDYEKQYNSKNTYLYLGFKTGKDLETIFNFLNSKKDYKVNLIEENTFFNQQSPNDFKYFLDNKSIDYKIVTLDSFSLNKNPSILLGSLYLIGEYKKRKQT